ncbi:hypothetical protein DFQ26_007831 [Actinomortierella ambigua]|nr:hypothetical protein DFQ26_007831 [Actinomortierella ambigua]
MVVAIPGGKNYSCYYMPGAGVALTYLNCTDDQASALKISLAIGFFLSVFLSFLKHVPIDGSGPPRADPVVLLPSPAENENIEQTEQDSGADESGADTWMQGGIRRGGGAGGTAETGAGIGVEGAPDGLRARSTRLYAGGLDEKGERLHKQQKQPQQQQFYYIRVQANQRPKYRRGVIYVEGNSYYLDFGDFHIWGHASLSFVAFGSLALCSASVSQCLFPQVKPWIFVFLQIILLVVCCFIAMFWINDPTLSLGLAIIQDSTAGLGQQQQQQPPPALPAPPKPTAPSYPDGRYDGSYPWQHRPPPASAAAAAAAAGTFASSPPGLNVSMTNLSSSDSLSGPSKVAKMAVSAKAMMIPSPMSSTTLESPISSSSGASQPPNGLPQTGSLMSEATATSGYSVLAGHVHHPYDAAEIVAARRVVINMDADNGAGAITEETREGGGGVMHQQQQVLLQQQGGAH